MTDEQLFGPAKMSKSPLPTIVGPTCSRCGVIYSELTAVVRSLVIGWEFHIAHKFYLCGSCQPQYGSIGICELCRLSAKEDEPSTTPAT
jgi:hypothetical protein